MFNVFLFLGTILALGSLVGRFTHDFKLTGVVGYIFTGILLGPLLSFHQLFGIGIKTVDEIWSFTTKLTLALIAFIIGGQLTIRFFRQLGKVMVILIFGETLATFALILAGCYLATKNLPMSLLLAAVGAPSAPVGTIPVLEEYRARGLLTRSLIAIVGWDDALAIMLFALSLCGIEILLGEEVSSSIVLQGIWQIVGALIIGTLLGLCLVSIIRRIHEKEIIFLAPLTATLVGAGLAEALGCSELLTCMMVGFVCANLQSTLASRMVHRVEEFMPPVYVAFFTLSGMLMDFEVLYRVGLLATVYMISRIIGKFGGCFVSARIAGAPSILQKYTGPALLSQAGVTIGLTALAVSMFPTFLKDALTLILATTIIFQIIGPVGVRYSITRAGEAKKL